jgi:hypothetical protein
MIAFLAPDQDGEEAPDHVEGEHVLLIDTLFKPSRLWVVTLQTHAVDGASG